MCALACLSSEQCAQLVDMEKQQHQHPGSKVIPGSGGQGAAAGPAPKDTDLDEIREKFRIVKVRHLILLTS